jgi:hypothetical protein
MELFSQDTLAIIGLIALALVVILVLLLLVGLIFAYAAFKNKRVMTFLHSKLGFFVIKVLLFIFDILYVPSRKIISILGGNEKMIDVVNIEMRNMVLKKRYSETPYAERLIVLPQCLRSLECPAKFSSIDGARCAKCDKCKITSITKKAEEMGYKGVYIAPGGGFVKRILKKIRPKAVIGVGCPVEVYWGLQGVSDAGLIGYGVLLLRDGCVMTDIDLDELFTVMEMREHEPK